MIIFSYDSNLTYKFWKRNHNSDLIFEMKEYTISNGFCMALGGFVNRNKKDSLSLLMVSWFKSPL